jgi:flagellin
MRGQIRGLDQAARNAQDGISMIQTAEGALSETHSILQRMRELAVQSSNDTNTADDRAEIQKEMNQLTSEITRIGNNTEFNTMKLINGDMTGGGTGATGGQISFEFNTIANGDKFDFTIGDETWSITFSKNDADTDDGALDLTAKTATIDVLAAGTDTDIAAAVQNLFDDLANGSNNSGLNTTSATVENLSNFTFTDSANRVTVKANNDGDFSGARDVRDLISATRTAGTGTADSLNASDGTAGNLGDAKLQIGANNSQTFTISVNDMRAATLKISFTATGDGAVATGVSGAYFATTALDDKSDVADEYALDVSTAERATSAIEVLDNAIQSVSQERSKLGAYQNRLEHTIANLGTSSENLTAAESRIRDVDMAKEMMEFTKNNILSQAAQAMLAQANQQPQGVLQLLR